MIVDDHYDPALLEGVEVDDWFVATVTYDTTAFGPGVEVVGDALDYPAPPGLQMMYHFESGGIFFKDITVVRTTKSVTNSQWNWKGGDFGGLLFQANDISATSFELPLPVMFDDMHTQFLDSLSML